MDNRTVCLPELNTGELLSEVIRAYMNQAVPSALLYRVALGLERFLSEDGPMPDQDAGLTETLRKEIEEMGRRWRKKEEEIYISPKLEKKGTP